ncbi:MAG TPA: glycosyltransferase 87 family protein [Candidatus Limnocylindrales bacterium]|nr:glycosyltransferase 87 family protein [Candidatus Limnocylindrales bacterium]
MTRPPGGGRRLAIPDLESGRAAWVVAALGVAAAILPAAGWGVPDDRGVPYPVALAAGIAAAVALLAAWRLRGERTGRRGSGGPPVGPLEALALVTGVAAVLGVLTILPSQPLRDLGVYLRAGEAFAAGEPVYLDRLIQAVPADRTAYPFLYPPALLPLFAVLAAAPRLLVDAAWILGSVAALLAALRAIGLPWRWAVAAIAWRPVFEGLWVGNVSVPLLACLALAVRYPWALAVPPAVKPYSATATLWLVRERRWRPLLGGVAGVGLVVAATLPVTGLDAWWQWLAGLDWFARSQPLLAEYLYGIALPRFLGPGPALAAGLIVLAAALVARGREGLARLGLATPAISPSVFVHGLLVAIPALGALRPAVLWVALAAMAFGATAGSWLGPALAVAAWATPTLRRSSAELRRPGVPDPLAGAAGPWPEAPE